MGELGPYFVEILRHYGYVLVFVGSFFGGEVAVLASAFLVSLGFFNIYPVIVLLLSGTVVSDHFWYWFGHWSKKVVVSSNRLVPFLGEKTENFKAKFDKHHARFLVVSKFIYGFRIFVLTLSGRRQVDYRRFALYNFIGTAIWLTFLMSLGYFLGFSWHKLENYNQTAKYMVFIGLILVVIVRFGLGRLLRLFNYESGN